MKICGIEIKGNEAVICLLSAHNGLFEIGNCRIRSLALKEPDSSEGMRTFQNTMKKLVEDYKIDKIAIKARMKKGKFAGSADGFKVEAALLLIDNLAVEVMTASQIKERLKDQPLPINFSETGLKAFQENAFITAYAAVVETNSTAN